MANTTKVSFIPALKLSETNYILYELQDKLGLDDEYLLSTTRCQPGDSKVENLKKLLESSKAARDNLITWYLKQTLVELNVTISLLTAKIKFIEYKLGFCDGLDLHQACSLSLVDFCNILSSMTIVNVSPSERKTLKQISAEVGVPVWLSHYRNQICHVPSESPCISILVPLVAKSLEYMRDSFWSKVLEHESFDQQKFKKCVTYISKLNYIISHNKRLHLKKKSNLCKKRAALAEQNLAKYTKICLLIRRMIAQNPKQCIDTLARFITLTRSGSSSRNVALLMEQIILAKQLDNFIFKLVNLVEENPKSIARLSWLRQMIILVGLRDENKLKATLKQMDLSYSDLIISRTDMSPLKCCQLAYRLSQMNFSYSRRMVITLRYKLLPILGKQKTILLTKMSKLVSDIKDD